MNQRLTAALEAWNALAPGVRVAIGVGVSFVIAMAAFTLYDAMIPTSPPTLGASIVIAAVVGATIWFGSRPSTRSASDDWAPQMPGRDEGSVITRVFTGDPATTSAAAARYLARVQTVGWREVSRTYTPGSWGCGAFLVALVLFFVLVGILIFIYMILVKPDGRLVVTYNKPQEARPAPAIAAPATDPARALSSLQDMLVAGLITQEDYDAKRADVLKRI